MESEISDRDDPDFIKGQRKVIILQHQEIDSYQDESEDDFEENRSDRDQHQMQDGAYGDGEGDEDD